MPNGPKGGLDRRDFMILALASVGATAVSGSADAAMTQDATESSAGPLPGAQQGTVYTGDVMRGKKVISALDVDDLAPGKHLFYFQGVQMPTGQHWYVSVSVLKGAKPGSPLRVKAKLEARDFFQRPAQRQQVSRTRSAQCHLSQQPFYIEHSFQLLAHLRSQNGLHQHLANRIQALFDFRLVHGRPQQPLAEQSTSHPGLGLVQHRKQRRLPRSAGRSAG